jgi:4-alpha-glucanotransferase
MTPDSRPSNIPSSAPHDYSYLLSSGAAKQWKRIGIQRRAGVIAPLFSIFSKKSAGIGEIPDLVLLADWCRKTGQSLIQLLPIQDTGFDFCPYDAQSSFALDPMYLRLDDLRGVEQGLLTDRIAALRRQFPTGLSRVNYAVKAQKLTLLWDAFQSVSAELQSDDAFKKFRAHEVSWLDDYSLYKVIRYLNHERSWTDWEPALRDREPAALDGVRREHAQTILFHQWMQWQLWEQMRSAKASAARRGVRIIGDLPFLVSRHSADVWANKKYFKLELLAGAPPDYFLQAGQRWGMPPYHWDRIAADGYRYLIDKLRYAQEFYDLYRIDHAIGMFRIWTIRMSEPIENAGRYGAFDPPDEKVWDEHGSKIMEVILANTRMLPCAEDLGVVPVCSDPALKRFGIPGMDIQRWLRTKDGQNRIVRSEEYRTNSIATLSTHDMYPVIRWWRDLPPNERAEFAEYFGLQKSPNSQDISAGPREAAGRALEAVSRSAAIFSIQSLQDWLSLGLPEHEAVLLEPTNVPGSFDPSNWSWVLPFSLEAMLDLPLNQQILDMNRASGRAPSPKTQPESRPVWHA